MSDRRNTAPGGALRRLAALLTARNVLDLEMAKIIGSPMEKGNFGEFVAAQIFDIELHRNRANPGCDGVFRSGELAGKCVNIKYYAKHDGNLDLKEEKGPDYYLVLTGPKKAAKTRPWVIESVFVFDAPALVRELLKRNPKKKIGTAAGVPVDLWEAAMIYPQPVSGLRPVCDLLPVTDARRDLLEMFASSRIG